MKYHSHYSRELRTEVVVGEGEEEKEEQVEQVRLYSICSEYSAAKKTLLTMPQCGMLPLLMRYASPSLQEEEQEGGLGRPCGKGPQLDV